MTIPITTGNIPNLLRPGLFSVFGNYNTFPDLWKETYSQHIAKHAVEYDLEMQSLPLAKLKLEGGPIALGDIKQAYESTYQILTYGIGFVITKEAIRDNLYPDQFPQQALNLRNSLSTVKNINGAALFNNAFDPNLSGGADLQPLASTQHPIVGGVVANTFNTATGLNESSLQDTITLMKGWKNVGGLQINTNARKLKVSQYNAYNASKLLNSAYSPASGINAINSIVHDKYIPGGFIVNQFILRPTFWAVLTDEPNGFKYFKKQGLEIDFLTDTSTRNVTVVADERYVFGYSNFRGAIINVGA